MAKVPRFSVKLGSEGRQPYVGSQLKPKYLFKSQISHLSYSSVCVRMRSMCLHFLLNITLYKHQQWNPVVFKSYIFSIMSFPSLGTIIHYYLLYNDPDSRI